MSQKKKNLITLFVSLFFVLAFIFFRTYKKINDLKPYISYLIGKDHPTSYLILLGNDTEVRANGGFTGSYAKITVSSNPFPFSLSSSFHDIYVPTGQLSGYVKPPEPVQQAFGKGSWDLSNADYEPDFPTSATTIRWFLEKGNEINPDILGIINLSTIKNILNVVGNFYIPEYDVTITPDNLYLFLQGKAEVNFFPGSTQKADALHNVGTALIHKAKGLPISKKIQIAKIIYEELNSQNIVVNSKNDSFQSFLVNQKWAGVYQPSLTKDFFGLVELNLGANKANQYVTHQTNHRIYTEDSNTIHEIRINLQNSSPEANPNPPLYYGGNYIAFFRIYLPTLASNIQINHTQIATNTAGINQTILDNQTPTASGKNGFTTLSFWHITTAGQNSYLSLSYTLPNITQENYSLTLLKQNGFTSTSQNVDIFGKISNINLNNTLEIK